MMTVYVNKNITKIIILLFILMTHKTTNSREIESFLPSLINVQPIIQMRATGNRDILSNLIDLKNFTFLIYPQSCGECENGFLLIVTIQSYVGNYDSRKAIRETWAKKINCIRILFFVGMTYDKSVMKSITEEGIRHRDIVQLNVEDTHRSLTYKHVAALKWVYQYCKEAKYVVKTDADIIVKLKNLYSLLGYNTWGDKGLIAGYIENNEQVLRDKKSPMKSRVVSMMEYKEEVYPPYCWGEFVIYSADVVPRLLEESRKVPYFKIEDIYVTGLLARNVPGIRHVNLIPDWYLSKASLGNLTLSASLNHVFGPYDLTSSEIRETWNLIEQSGVIWVV